MTTCFIIPAFNPNESLTSLVKEMVAKVDAPILIVDDGSEDKKLFQDSIFAHKNVTLLNHGENLGKGAALKTAFNYILSKFPEMKGCVTLDADGQHAPEDARNVASKLGGNNSLILGVRNFTATNKHVPLKSRVGNLLTRKIWQIATGINVKDTQTGLRGIPVRLMRECLLIKENRYEFEMEMLFRAQKMGVEICEVPISMIYIDDNKGSHFNPVWDSLRIYYVLLRFCFSSLFSLLVDYMLFSLFVFVFSFSASMAYIIARIFSGMVNYKMNKNLVFHFEHKNKLTLFKYVALFTANMYIGFSFIEFVSKYSHNPLFYKVFIESILFFFNFYIQKEWVFRRRT